MNLPRVIARGLRAQLRQSETRLFMAALLFAVAALATVQLGAQRTLDLLLAKAAEINGGDLSISSRSPLPDDYRERAVALQLRAADSLSFPSMLFAGEAQQLADVKAVAGDYPVRGQLRVLAAGADAPAVVALPAAGEAYADGRLLQALAIAPGDNIELGGIVLRVAGELVEDPDGSQLFAMAPRLLVGLDDARRAGLLGPGSRAGHRLLLAGGGEAVRAYRDWIKPRLAAGQRMSEVADAAANLRGAYDRGRSFIDLALLLCLALSALAMWLALARMAEREADSSALLRCLGASRREVLLLPLGQVMLLALPCTVLGLLLGWLAEGRVNAVLSARFGVEAPPLDVGAAVPTLVMLVLLLLACVLPPLFSLLRVPPLRTLQSNAARPGSPVRWLVLPLLGLPVAGLLLGGDPTLVLVLLLGLAAAAGLCALLIWLSLFGLKRLAPRFDGLTRLALLRLARRPLLALLQGSALAVALTALLIAARVGPDLLGQWQASLPENTPNWFVLNIQPEQREGVEQALTGAGATSLGVMPVAIGRLTTIAGKPTAEHVLPDPEMSRWRDGPLNLSWSPTLPEGNTLAAGTWWPADADRPLASLEQRFAERLGVGIGDRLGLQIGERAVEVEIANLRATDWDSFRVNFFIVLNPAAAEAVPHGLIASFHLPESAAGEIRGLTRSYRNLSPIDVGAILGRIRDLVADLAAAAQAMLSLALFAAGLVLFGALAYAQSERRREAALLRAMGIRKIELARLLALEWLTLGVIAAVVATGLAALTGWLLAREVFQFDYRPGWALPAIAFAVALLVSGVAAWAAARTATRTPPAESLRA
jgi:putative ABC transport system permease protein